MNQKCDTPTFSESVANTAPSSSTSPGCADVPIRTLPAGLTIRPLSAVASPPPPAACLRTIAPSEFRRAKNHTAVSNTVGACGKTTGSYNTRLSMLVVNRKLSLVGIVWITDPYDEPMDRRKPELGPTNDVRCKH